PWGKPRARKRSRWRRSKRSSRDPVAAVHVRAQRLRDGYRAILLLVVLENRNYRAADREARSVQRVNEFGLARAGGAGAELDVGAARLERLGVAARRDLAEPVAARQPDLDVVGLRGREAHISGAQQHAAVRQLEPFEHRFRVRRQRLELVVGALRRRDPDQLHLVELMLPVDAADVLAVRAGFAPEARRVGDVMQRKLPAVEDLVAMQARQRHLSGGDEIEIPLAADLEQV